MDEKNKKRLSKQDIFYMSAITLSVVAIFSLGYFISNLIKFQKPVIVVEKNRQNDNSIEYTKNFKNLQVQVIASVNSDKYHYEHCSGAKRISEKNKIYFKDAAEAEEAGFRLADNCK